MSSPHARHTPFDKDLEDVPPAELQILRETHEGWYVEYKSDLSSNRVTAKSLSAFANQYGGLLFIGVSTVGGSNVADSFPGLPDPEVDGILGNIRNSSKDLLNPPVYYETRTFQGPIDEIGLQQGQSIIAVRIPQGAETPYVHNDGRIYRRVADSSDPVHETDRSTLELLHDRRRRAHEKLETRIMHAPPVSESEENQPYIHFHILSDPYETMGHWYSEGMDQFSETMRGGFLPFDNIFRSNEGFVARQIGDNDPYYRLLTWEFSRKCHSLVTVPMNVIQEDGEHEVSLERFLYQLKEAGYERPRVLDLSHVMMLALSIAVRHRRLAHQAGISGPFYIKLHIQNAWRTIPFIDVDGFFRNTEEFGFPLVQGSDIVVPNTGTSLEDFILLEARDMTSEIEVEEIGLRDNVKEAVADMVRMSLGILTAFGISPDLIPDLDQLVTRRIQVRHEQ